MIAYGIIASEADRLRLLVRTGDQRPVLKESLAGADVATRHNISEEGLVHLSIGRVYA